MKFILGKKIEMTQIWKDDKVIAVTKVQAGPCVVTQVKNQDKDKYEAVQIAFGDRKEKNIKKPQKGHLKKANTSARYMREFRVEASELKPGQIISASTFEVGDTVQVSGISKGKGFQGVVKRHGFKGAIKTHGTKDQVRMPGSIGATGPAHVFKGTRMGGRMGNDKVTLKNLEIIEIDIENNILFVKGAIPGARNGLIMISGEGELKIDEVKEQKEVKEEEKETEKKEEVKAEVESKVEEKKEEPKKEAQKSDNAEPTAIKEEFKEDKK